MKLDVRIKKNIGSFRLDLALQSDASRIGILGASGSGKSMTLRCIAGIERPDSGYIAAAGRSLYDSGARLDLKPQQRKVGYMFQNYALFPTMTVLQNVECGIRNAAKAERRERALDMLRRMRLDGYENRLPGELSGGQQQRTALARILAGEPELILLDEPFSALDSALVDRMQHEMMELLEDFLGQTVMVSHSRDELYRFSQEIFVVREGSVIRHDETRRLFADPRKLDVARMTGCKNFSAVRVLDAHHLEATDWGISLELSRDIPPDTRYIGYRAHFFRPVWGERQKNCIRFSSISTEDTLFEQKYYFAPESGLHTHSQEEASRWLSWFVQEHGQQLIRERGLPDYLRLDEEQILLLEA